MTNKDVKKTTKTVEAKPTKEKTTTKEKPKTNVTNVEKKHYKNPTEAWWGKLVVWILVFGMVGAVILSFVLAIIQGNA
ncbi:MAG: hypothetical protein IH571_03925 [Acholeplasmataceae bacterium]|nr:hypothetical protein [Acholeplasmataceae bacterium]